MIKGNSVSVATIKENKLLYRPFKAEIGYGQNVLNYYLSRGYKPYDVTANSGFANVTGVTGALVVCVFTELPAVTRTYEMRPAYLAGKTSVIVLGVSVNNITALIVNGMQYYKTGVYNGYYTINYTTAFDYTALGLRYELMGLVNHNCSFPVSLTGLQIYNCNTQWFTNINIVNYLIDYSVLFISAGCASLTQNASSYIKNTALLISGLTSYTISGTGSLVYKTVIDMQNSTPTFNAIGTITELYILFTDTSTRGGISGSAAGTGFIDQLNVSRSTMASMVLTPVNVTGKTSLNQNFIIPIFWNSYNSTLDFTALAALNHYTVDALITPEYRVNDGLYQTVRNYYILDFMKSHAVPDQVKYINPAVLWVVKRTDIEAVLAPASPLKIKNGILYANDGTTPYSYLQDENFIIIAANGSDNQAFLWYNGDLFKTIWSEPAPGTTYTISACYQIWQMEPPVRVRNVYDITDSPMEGTITFNNLDNEVSA